MSKTTFGVAAVVVCMAAISSARASHIDYLSDAGFLLVADSASGPATASQTGDPGNILGAERDVEISFSAGSGFLVTGLSVPSGPGPVGPDPSKRLLFSNSVRSRGALSLRYDGVGSAGLGGLDFDTTWNSIAVGVPELQGGGDLKVTVTDTGSNSGTLTKSISLGGSYLYPFTDAAYTGVDFTAVDLVEVVFVTTVAATDIAISEVTRDVGVDDMVLPEPATAMLAVAGLFFIATCRQL